MDLIVEKHEEDAYVDILRMSNALLVRLTRHAESLKVRGIRNYFLDRDSLSYAQRRVLAKWVKIHLNSPNYGEEILQAIRDTRLTRIDSTLTKG